ncbi:Hypothetical protein D9617_4g000510 [Elsinoe fawcettii]|nr:Hypothetical protein D9617_4g000510 [Elsinoe fawcettii]
MDVQSSSDAQKANECNRAQLLEWFKLLYPTLLEQLPPKHDIRIASPLKILKRSLKPGRAQAKSHFFELPREIRDQIYREAGFLDSTVHMFLEQYDSITTTSSGCSKSDKRWRYLVRPCYRPSDLPKIRDCCRDEPEQVSFGLLPFLMTCRQAYQEVAKKFYDTAIFSIASIPLARAIHSYLPQSLVLAIQRLEILVEIDPRQHVVPIPSVPEHISPSGGLRLYQDWPVERDSYARTRGKPAESAILSSLELSELASLSSLTILIQMRPELLDLHRQERTDSMSAFGGTASVAHNRETTSMWVFWHANLRMMFNKLGRNTLLVRDDSTRDLVVESEIWMWLERGENT